MKKPQPKPTPPTPAPTPQNSIRVSISEAAKLFGVNPQTIRRAIQAKEVSYIVVANRYKLNFESLVNWSQKKTTVRNKSSKKGIGQYIEKWRIKNPLYSPSLNKNTPKNPEETDSNTTNSETHSPKKL